MNGLTEQVKERFWKGVKKQDGCWEWQRSCTARGYGQMGIKNQVLYTHRLSWELANGAIPKGMCICHTCDNRKCCNPNHLFLGTQKENMHDMYWKGRGAGKFGYVTNTKLTPAEVKSIRQLIAERTMPFSDIGDLYGISRYTVENISGRRSWAWVE